MTDSVDTAKTTGPLSALKVEPAIGPLLDQVEARNPGFRGATVSPSTLAGLSHCHEGTTKMKVDS